jgi:hypothetical protein
MTTALYPKNSYALYYTVQKHHFIHVWEHFPEYCALEYRRRGVWYEKVRYKALHVQRNNRIHCYILLKCQFQWPRGLRCRSTAARLLRSWVRIPRGGWRCGGWGSLRRADHSSRGVLPTVALHFVWSRNLVNEELRCPDEVDGDIWILSTRRCLKPKFY